MKTDMLTRLTSRGLVFFGAALAAYAGNIPPGISILSNFNAINLNQTIGLGTGATPPDMGMAAGPNAVVQMVNGGYQVYNRSGTALTPVTTDTAFWSNAGVSSTITAPGLSDPRVIYDPSSGRFFASQINVVDTGNTVLLGVSNTSNPLDGWKAVSFTGNSGFADFPMLGLDQNGVYVGTNNFTSSTGTFTGVSLFSIPKADLLGAAPSAANLTGFNDLNAVSYGFGPFPAIDFSGTNGAVLAISATDLNQALTYNIFGSSGAGALLSSTTLITGLNDGAPRLQHQPDGSSTVDGGDDRFGSAPFVVGNLLYAVNTIGDTGDPNATTHDILHWLIMDMTTKLILQQGTFDDPNYDYTYASIAANANGDFVIGFNRSGPATNIGGYAAVCHYDGTSAACGNPLLLVGGQVGDYHLGSFDRWGDYSSIALDPLDPNSFWVATEIPVQPQDGQSRWGTQIMQLELEAAPEPGTMAIAGLALAGLGWLRRRQGVRLS